MLLFYSFCKSNKSVSGDIVVPQSDVRQSPGQASQLNVWVWSTGAVRERERGLDNNNCERRQSELYTTLHCSVRRNTASG